MRPHVAALYAFARAADDFADEGDLPAGARVQLIDGWERRLFHAARSLDAPWPASPGEPRETPEIFIALRESIRALSLPVSHFEALLSAFRQDVTVTRYRTWDQMMQYCQRSANPVGRLVLRIAGYDNPNLDAASDAMCRMRCEVKALIGSASTRPAVMTDRHGSTGMTQVGTQVLGKLARLLDGNPDTDVPALDLVANPFWPAELAAEPKLPHERCVTLLPFALSRTQDDKGRVRWTLFGNSEQGPGKAFWKGFRALGEGVIGKGACGKLAEAVLGLERMGNVRELTGLTVKTG